MSRFAFLALLLSLGACAQVGQFTADDLAAAQALATTSGDAAGVSCWSALTPIAVSVENNKSPGLASKIELERTIQGVVQTQCSGIAASILQKVISVGSHGILP